LVRRALIEDLGPGDITTSAIVPRDVNARAVLLAKSACVLAGMDVACEVFAQVDANVAWRPEAADGEACEVGRVLANVAGPARAILAAERTALNFLQHLCGIATAAREYVTATGGHITILDTRKTLPGYRAAAKYAVRCGGGQNHRVGLYDGILIKDNHIRVAGGVAEAIRLVRATGTALPIEVEVQSAEELDAAIEARADIIMLDNFDDGAVQGAVARIAGRARIELSGGMTLARVRSLASSGADYVSVGAITHSVVAADISLEVEMDVRPSAL
jgi:nicotinate-nucleotide pyrophosphorylase (carboxylating)